MKVSEKSIRSIAAAGVVGLLLFVSLSSRAQASAQVIRVIDDQSTGDRWLLVRDAAHPEGPGKMVRVKHEPTISNSGDSNPLREAASSAGRQSAPVVIRTGDRVIVEEHSPVVDARLEAVALGSAAVGAELSVQLKIGGRIVHAVALGPGRTKLQPETKARP